MYDRCIEHRISITLPDEREHTLVFKTPLPDGWDALSDDDQILHLNELEHDTVVDVLVTEGVLGLDDVPPAAHAALDAALEADDDDDDRPAVFGIAPDGRLIPTVAELAALDADDDGGPTIGPVS